MKESYRGVFPFSCPRISYVPFDRDFAKINSGKQNIQGMFSAKKTPIIHVGNRKQKSLDLSKSRLLS